MAVFDEMDRCLSMQGVHKGPRKATDAPSEDLPPASQEEFATELCQSLYDELLPKETRLKIALSGLLNDAKEEGKQKECSRRFAETCGMVVNGKNNGSTLVATDPDGGSVSVDIDEKGELKLSY